MCGFISDTSRLGYKAWKKRRVKTAQPKLSAKTLPMEANVVVTGFSSSRQSRAAHSRIWFIRLRVRTITARLAFIDRDLKIPQQLFPDNLIHSNRCRQVITWS